MVYLNAVGAMQAVMRIRFQFRASGVSSTLLSGNNRWRWQFAAPWHFPAGVTCTPTAFKCLQWWVLEVPMMLYVELGLRTLDQLWKN